MKKGKSRSPPKLSKADFRLFWLVCYLPARTRIGFKLLFVVIWLMAIGMFSRNVEWCAIFMLISVSLIYALVLFLSNYLLYRYEKRE